ncbi:MAG: peptidase T [Lachnospiraceae bacterium]|jgi:tripeptide aminopeptidase|nr:peptidase T [Lachnospiraceae bacterium]
MHVSKRFLQYVRIDTTSDPDSATFPSTPDKQLPFADSLVEEMKSIGITDACRDEYGYVMGTIPSTIENYTGPILGFVAHMDTSCDAPGANIQPRIIEAYDGRDIVLNTEKNIVMRTSEFENLAAYQGKSLIVTDGITLLGADDKAGIAEIMTAAEALIQNPQILHGPIRIGFTPDEEVGQGVAHFDVQKFGADYAYTLDGGTLGELEYENFNAASAVVEITGLSIHPGSAKNKMLNAALIGMEFQSMLPTFERPEYTENREGFTHLISISGSVEHATLKYIIRDHDTVLYEKKKAFMQSIADFLNHKYGEGTICLTIKDSYFNMKEQIEPHMVLIDHVIKVYEELGIQPHIQPIRGGTDGARLSFMGLPCPNLGTGSQNCHGHFEFACIEDMETSVQVVIKLAELFAK